MAEYERKIIEQIRTLLGNLEGAIMVADDMLFRQSLLRNPKIWLHPTHPLYGRLVNLDNSITKNEHADFKAVKEEELPPIYENITVRPKGKSGLQEYRFMLEGKQRSVYGYSKKECWQRREEIVSGKTKENVAKVSKKQISFGDWLLTFYKTYKIRKDGTKINPDNEKYIERIINPRLGSIQLKALNGLQIQSLLTEYDNRTNTQRKLAILMNEALDIAVKNDYIKKNPMQAVKIDKHKSVHYPVIQIADQRRIIENIDMAKYRALFMLCCCTGMRITETIHSIPHIDYENHIITVVDKDTSTKKHRRQIPFLPGLISQSDKDLLSQITVTGAQTYFKRLFNALGINVVVHSFRVTFVSCCNYVGINIKQIQEWAGHSDITTTMNTYAKLLKKKRNIPRN